MSNPTPKRSFSFSQEPHRRFRPRFKLKLDIPRKGVGVEVVLFKALLSYAEGRPVIVWAGVGATDAQWILHGDETMQHIRESGTAIKTTVFRIECDDAEEVQRIGKMFNAEDCDWLELLEAARTNFMEHGASRNESYVAWIRHEIAGRERVK